jgi:hypothetical protein
VAVPPEFEVVYQSGWRSPTAPTPPQEQATTNADQAAAVAFLTGAYCHCNKDRAVLGHARHHRGAAVMTTSR